MQESASYRVQSQYDSTSLRYQILQGLSELSNKLFQEMVHLFGHMSQLRVAIGHKDVCLGFQEELFVNLLVKHLQ